MEGLPAAPLATFLNMRATLYLNINISINFNMHATSTSTCAQPTISTSTFTVLCVEKELGLPKYGWSILSMLAVFCPVDVPTLHFFLDI